MEREKKPKRGGYKSLHASDLIALGSKPSSKRPEDLRSKPKSRIATSVGESSGSSASASSSKKTKPPSFPKRQDSAKSAEWEKVAVEIDSNELVGKVLEAENNGNDDKVEALLCGAVKKLKSSSENFDSPLSISLLFLVKTRPTLFCSKVITDAFCSLLFKDEALKLSEKSSSVAIHAANILMAAHKNENSWSESFVKAFVEDSLGDRMWVDNIYCRSFVTNILTAFHTKVLNIRPEEASEYDGSSPSGSLYMMEDLESSENFSRYLCREDHLSGYVLEILKEQLMHRQSSDISPNVLHLLSSACGIRDVRLMASTKIEMWLHNSKLSKAAQELLQAICLNSKNDIDVISHLVKLRLKNKSVNNYYLQCMKQLIDQNQENLSPLLKHVLYDELSNSRNPNNMPLISITFQHAPDRAAKVLASIFLELLCNKDCYLKASRALLREIIRTGRDDLNFPVFCAALLQEVKTPIFINLEAELKERMFQSVIDLITFSIFMGISPTIKEQYLMFTKGERKNFSALRMYQKQVANIQKDTSLWVYTLAPKIYNPNRDDFVQSICKLLFVSPVEAYSKVDSWPNDIERNILYRVASDVPLLEETLLCVLHRGSSVDHLLTPQEAVDLVEKLIKKSAVCYSDDFPALELENTEISNMVFSLCAFHYSETQPLPQGYRPPNLAVSELYWKAWTLLLIIVCHNPSTFGETAWKTCPMLKNLMEMCITNQFIFPPPTIAPSEKEKIENKEIQMSKMENDEILRFETYISGASDVIPAAKSRLLSKLIFMDPHGPARKPPSAVMESLRGLNETLGLGRLLCGSRNPDFMMDVVHSQGMSQAKYWLRQLVESNSNFYNLLPVHCLCELFVSDSTDNNSKIKRQEQLLLHLRDLLFDSSNETDSAMQILGYFFERLTSKQPTTRTLSFKGLNMLLTKLNSLQEQDIAADNNKFEWLLNVIPQLTYFPLVRRYICQYLKNACLVETDPPTIISYVKFLNMHTLEYDAAEMSELVLEIAPLLLERITIVTKMISIKNVAYYTEFLPAVNEIYLKYFNIMRISSNKMQLCHGNQDHVHIRWPSGDSITLLQSAAHAMITLLTYGPDYPCSRSYYDTLMGLWFPYGHVPKAFETCDNTYEEDALLPVWLRLRMVKSPVGFLVDVALQDLDPAQLVLFVQSFGLPVDNMSKLLMALDHAVEYDCDAVKQAVGENSYISQLIHVQHLRGAKGGEKFAELLQEHEDMDTTTESSCIFSFKTPVIQRKPQRRLTLDSRESIESSFINLLGMNHTIGLLTAEQENSLFKSLQKALTFDVIGNASSDSTIRTLILTCERLLRSESKMLFLQALNKKSHYFSVLLKLMTISQIKTDETIQNLITQKLKWICQQILYSSPTSLSLITVASQFYNKYRPTETKKVVPWKAFVEKHGAKDVKSISIVIELTEAGDFLRLEELMQYLVMCAISKKDTNSLMQAMTSMTMKKLSNQAELQTFNSAGFCFFIDWLEYLLPKLIHSYPESHKNILFSQMSMQKNSVPFRRHLLAFLIHQYSWEVLHYFLNFVLNPASSTQTFDPTSVLDFINAFVFIPRIQTGQRKENQYYGEENCLPLLDHQVTSIVQFILEEGTIKCMHEKDVPAETALVAVGIPSIENRLKLLMKCFTYNTRTMRQSINFILSLLQGNDIKAKLAKQLLILAYHQVPPILALISNDVSLFSGIKEDEVSLCKLDVISHTLFLSMTRSESNKKGKEKMSRIGFVLKKITSTHPLLILRQMPMLISLLRGKIHLSYRQLKMHNNNLTFFSCSFSIIEMLPPLVFETEFSKVLNDILTLFMDFFQIYGIRKELVPILHKFIAFLMLYYGAKPVSARQFIQKHSIILLELCGQHPLLYSYKPVLSEVCLRHHGPDSEATAEDSTHDSTGIPCRSLPQSRIQSTMRNLLRGHSEETWASLKELDNLTRDEPATLGDIANDLKILMLDENTQYRSTAFNLVMRYLKNSPSCGKNFVSIFLQCLESEQIDIVETALEHLPEFTVLVQESASHILLKVFNIGVTKCIDTSGPITTTLSYLLAQRGC